MASGNEIQTGFGALDELISGAERMQKISKADINQIVQQAVPKAEKIARKELVVSFRRSGVKSKTGDLLRAVKKSVVKIGNGSRGSFISIFMPPDFNSTDKKTKNFYAKANSVNFGRVNSKEFDVSEKRLTRGPTGLKEIKNFRSVGARRRRALKKKVQAGGEIVKGTKISDTLYSSGVISKTKAGSVKVSTTSGTATVTKAFDFFTLKKGQKAVIRNEVFKEIDRLLNIKLNRLFGG